MDFFDQLTRQVTQSMMIPGQVAGSTLNAITPATTQLVGAGAQAVGTTMNAGAQAVGTTVNAVAPVATQAIGAGAQMLGGVLPGQMLGGGLPMGVQPLAPKQDNTMLYVMLGGGVLVSLIVIVVILKKP